MKVLWTLFKVVIALVLVIPVSILVLATALGILGALVGIAVLALKLALLALVGYGAFRLVAHLVGGAGRRKRRDMVTELPPADPHYESAMRELDRELGQVPR